LVLLSFRQTAFIEGTLGSKSGNCELLLSYTKPR